MTINPTEGLMVRRVEAGEAAQHIAHGIRGVAEISVVDERVLTMAIMAALQAAGYEITASCDFVPNAAA